MCKDKILTGDCATCKHGSCSMFMNTQKLMSIAHIGIAHA